jgi:hypothetical protein
MNDRDIYVTQSGHCPIQTGRLWDDEDIYGMTDRERRNPVIFLYYSIVYNL